VRRALLLVFLLSCGRDAPRPPEQAVALPENLVVVPLVRQQTNYSCGDAAALALLRYWDATDYAATPESALYAPLQTSEEDGTDPVPIRDYLAGVAGLHADYLHDAVSDADLVAAVDRKEPPIVDIQAWQDRKADWSGDWDDGHYVVLVGYDAQRFYFMDPSTDGQYAYIPRAEFDARWHDVVGKATHTFHMAVFVHGEQRPAPLQRAAPPSVTRIE
jgi:predicted double-glycine peptidase